MLSQVDTICRKKGIKKADLYEQAGISAAAVSQWRTGKTTPSQTSIKNIAACLGVSVSELTGEEMYEIFVQLCRKWGTTPYRISKETGVSQATLSTWKTGTNKPRLSTLKKIADYFGVSVEYLMGETSQKEKLAPEGELDAKDQRLINWFRSLPPEKQKAILSLGDGPEDAAD